MLRWMDKPQGIRRKEKEEAEASEKPLITTTDCAKVLPSAEVGGRVLWREKRLLGGKKEASKKRRRRLAAERFAPLDSGPVVAWDSCSLH